MHIKFTSILLSTSSGLLPKSFFAATKLPDAGGICQLQPVVPHLPIVRSHMGQQGSSREKVGIANDFVEIFNWPNESSVKMPRIGLGVFQASSSETEAAVGHALHEGYRHVDTAALYRNEAAVGRAVRESGIPREDLFITTKLWNSDHGYENTLRAFDRSLQQLGLEYVDLYLVHSPMPKQKRLDTWRAMEAILESGKARAIGVSNYGEHHLEELLAHCRIRPAVNQIELHPFLTREALVRSCQQRGVVLAAYSPLTKGLRLKDPTLEEVSKRCQKSPAQVLIRWAMQKGFVVLPKSVKAHRIAENANVYDFEISSGDMVKLDSLNEDYVTGWDPTTGA